MLKPPRRIASRTIASYPYLALHEHDVAWASLAAASADPAALDASGGDERMLALTLTLTDWCVTAAVTAAGEWVLVEQHRHGVDAITLEPAGGIIDEGEAPRAAASRELQEETGFGGGQLESLGWVHPNPALSSNRAHLFFARDVRKLSEIAQRPAEVTRVVLLSSEDVRRSLHDGAVSSALSIIALARALDRHADDRDTRARQDG